MEEFYSVFTNFLIIFSIVNAVLYIIGLAKTSKAYKIFTLYLAAMAIVQMISSYYASVLHENNLFMFHYYYLLQFYILSLFFYYLLQSKWLVYTTIIVSIILGILYIREPGIFFKYTPLGVTLTQSVLIAYIINYFYRSLSGALRFIYINIGLFFFLLTSILVFASGNLMLDLDIAKEKGLILSYINESTYFVFLLLALIEWLKNHSSFLFKRKADA